MTYTERHRRHMREMHDPYYDPEGKADFSKMEAAIDRHLAAMKDPSHTPERRNAEASAILRMDHGVDQDGPCHARVIDALGILDAFTWATLDEGVRREVISALMREDQLAFGAGRDSA